MVDLHLHLDGSLNPENIYEMAEMSEVILPEYSREELNKLLMVEPDCRNLGEYLEKFELPLKLLQTAETIEYAVYELMRDLDAQGICYAEIRFAPQLHKKKGLSQDEVVQTAIRGLDRGNSDFSLSANLILCCMRGNDNRAENAETVQIAGKYLGKGVCAVDLAGNEAAYPTEQFFDVLSDASANGIPVVIHAGEAAGAESMRQALSIGAVRIGHGIHAVEDSRLMELLKEKNISLEMCYSSNMQTKTVDRKEDYPIIEFLNHGICVTLNTDNMTVSGTTQKKEYNLVREEFGLSEDTLQQIALNALEVSFLDIEKKEELKKRIKEEFKRWLNT